MTTARSRGKPEETPDPEPLSDETRKEREERERMRLAGEQQRKHVGSEIMSLLGAPSKFVRVDARRVGNRAFRVNVHVEHRDESELCVFQQTRIAHSFYVEVDGDGDVMTTQPPIRRIYEVE